MIDGKFSNFCPKDDGSFVYVDLFPAHIHDRQSHLLKPSNDHRANNRSLYTDSFITGDMYGILGRFLETLRRDHPDLWTTVENNTHLQTLIAAMPQDLSEYCTFLLEDDTRFIQAVYKFGQEKPASPQFDHILNPSKYRIAQ